MIITAYSVTSRYVFNSPSIYALEISIYFLIACTWGAVGWIHKIDRHVSVDFFILKLPGFWGSSARIVSELAVLTFCTMLIFAGTDKVIESFEKSYRSTSLLEMPLWIPYAAMPIGGFLLATVTIARLTTKSGEEV
ncbi:TRAP transporter small permease [Marinobacter salexigens]